jgi:hypothetical protein
MGESRECARCGAVLVAASAENLETLIAAEVSARLSGDKPASSRDEQRRAADRAAAEARATRQAERERTESERQARSAAREAEKRRRHNQRKHQPAEPEPAPNDEVAPASTSVVEALESVISAGPRGDASVGAVLYENIGWFLGALLVLAGSVYGVREAWLAFGETGRYLTVGSAFFVYHLMFVGLAALLAARADTASRVVAGIGVGLLPIVGAAFANLLRVAPSFGTTVGVAFVGSSALTTWWAGRRLLPAAPILLAAVSVLGLGAEIPLDLVGAESAWRGWLPLAALVAPLAVLYLAPTAQLRLDPLIVAIYFAGAVEIFALVSGSATGQVVWQTTGVRSGLRLGLYFSFVGAVFANAGMHQRWLTVARRLFGALSVVGVAIAVVATATVALTLLDVTRPLPSDVVAVAVVTSAVATACALGLRARFAGAVYPALLTATVLAFTIARASLPALEWSSWWMVAAAVPSTYVLARGRREGLAILSAIQLVALFFASYVVPGALTAFGPASAVIAIAFVVAGHFRARVQGRHWHYVAGTATLGAWWLASSVFPWPKMFVAGTTLWLAYTIASRFDESPDERVRPHADVSFTLAGLLVLVVGSRFWTAPNDVRSQIELAVALVCLGARGVLDGSALGAALPLWLATLFVSRRFGANENQLFARWVAAATLAISGVAALLAVRLSRSQNLTDRRLFGFLPLPLAASGRTLFVDGLATASIGCLLVSLWGVVGFLGNVNELTRGDGILGGILLIGTALVAFLSSSHQRFTLRGREATLWGAAFLIAVVAVVNRIGRPLPPAVVGRNLSVIAVAIWGVALAFFHFGPAVARWLGREADGYRYHRIPHAGVAALALLLVYDAFAIGPPTLVRALSVTPPTFFLGPAVMCLLLARSLSWRWLPPVAFALLVVAGGLVASEHSIVGPELSPLRPPGGQWVPVLSSGSAMRHWLTESRYLSLVPGRDARSLYQDFELGAVLVMFALAVVGAGFRGTSRNHLSLAGQTVAAVGLLTWALVATATSSVPVALVGAAAIAVVMLSAAHRQLYSLGPLALPWVVHAFAQRGAVIPTWVGPLFAACGIPLVLGTVQRVGLGSARSAALRAASVATVVTSGLAVVYALATFGSVDRSWELSGVVVAAFTSRPWWLSYALPLTVLIIAVNGAGLAAAFSRTGDRRATPSTMLSLLCVAGALVLGHVTWRAQANLSASDLWWLQMLAGVVVTTTVVLGLALVLLALFSATRDEIADGAAYTRDVLLIIGLTAASIMATAFRGGNDWPSALFWLVFVAIGANGAIALVTALRRGKPLHMYVAQSSLLVLYGVLRAGLEQSLRPEDDAIFILVLGFALVGAMVAARRAQLPPIAAAIRHFVALLPPLLGLLLPWRASSSGAALAAGSALLYSVIGWVEEKRIFGVAGAIAANVALLVFALSRGIQGPEVYCVPLGLVLLISVHLFASDLSAEVRQPLRLLGSALLYVPSALAVVFQVGNAQEAIYPVFFGIACLIGVAVGMVLHIRAYLFLGAAFFTLDIVANLVRASLRDQRLGFFVLSSSGLLILAAMVGYTLRKTQVRALLSRYLAVLKRWD